MNREFINIYMQEKNIPSGYLKAWYNFSSGETASGVIYNQVNTVSDHYYNKDNYEGSLTSGTFASISVGGGDVITSNGVFDHTELVQISEDVDVDNWTVFLDFSGNQQDETGRNKILLSSMNDSGDTSGFYIGLNGYNKPFITYRSTDDALYTSTFSRETSNRDLFSFSFNSDGRSLNIGKHTPKEDLVESFVSYPIKNSNTWTIGGFKQILNQSPQPQEISNFDGKINHFMLFNPSLKGGTAEQFSDFLFIKDYEKEQVKQRQTVTQKNISGSHIALGVVGTGITGYEKVLISSIGGAQIYASSGVTGEISGDVIAFTSETETVTGYESFVSQEIKTYDDSISSQFFNNKITFLKNVDSGYSLPESGSLYVDNTRKLIQRISYSGYEVASSSTVNDNTRKIANWSNLSGAFILQSGIGNGKHINLFRNGLLQRSGTFSEVNVSDTDGTGFADYTLLNDRFIYSNNRYNETDYIIYEECNLPNIIGGYTQGEAAAFMYHNGSSYVHGSTYFFDDRSNLVNRDLYFGGIKLISGVDYDNEFSAAIITVHTSGLNNGVFSWIEKVSSKEHNTETGHLSQQLNLNNNLMEEIVWLSGIRQRKDVDYITTADFSVLGSGFKFNKTPNNFIIYSGETGFFNT